MRVANGYWVVLLALVLLTLGGCASSNIDDGDSANVVLQVLTLDNPPVSGDLQTGTCINSGLECLSDANCDPLDPTDVCILDVTGGECLIVEWSANLVNVPKSDLAGTSPFNDIVMQDVTIFYTWDSPGVNTPPLTVPLAGTIPANGGGQVTFFPITASALAIVTAALPDQSRSANLDLLFRGVLEDGSDVQVQAGQQLFIDPCGN